MKLFTAETNIIHICVDKLAEWGEVWGSGGVGLNKPGPNKLLHERVSSYHYQWHSPQRGRRSTGSSPRLCSHWRLLCVTVGGGGGGVLR